jgi:hypothetical protein
MGVPDHQACKRCDDALTGPSRAIGVCSPCAAAPARLTRVERARYGWERRTQEDRHHREAWTWLKRSQQRP